MEMPAINNEMKKAFTLRMDMDQVTGIIVGPNQAYYPDDIRARFALNRLAWLAVSLVFLYFPVTALFNLKRVAMNDADLIVGGLVLGVVMMFKLWRSPKRWVTFREKRAKFRPRQTPFELHLDRLHLGEHQWTWDAVEAIECDQEVPDRFWVQPRTGKRRGFRAKQASPEQVSTLV